MIRRTVWIQLAAFGVITVLGVLYAGFDLIGVNAIRRPYVVTARFPSSGGIFTNAEVTYRGVGVGRVGALSLAPDGVDVELRIDRGEDVPRDTLAVVANKSAVGEQFVDLQPRSDRGPYLRDGDRIALADTRVPVDINTVLVDLDRLARSIDQRALRALVSGLGDAFEGTGPTLRQLIESGDALTATLTEKLPETLQLIRQGEIVLRTARDTQSDLRRFAEGLADLSESLRSADPDVRRLLDNGVTAARELDALLAPRQAALHVLLSDLVTISGLQVERLDALRQTLISYPLLVEVLPQALQDGQLHNGLVTEEQPEPCTYEDTERRLPRDDEPREPNAGAECEPGEGGARGARSVHPDGPGGSGDAGPGRDATPDPDGSPARPAAVPALRWTGGQQDLLGEQSWLALLLALI